MSSRPFSLQPTSGSRPPPTHRGGGSGLKRASCRTRQQVKTFIKRRFIAFSSWGTPLSIDFSRTKPSSSWSSASWRRENHTIAKVAHFYTAQGKRGSHRRGGYVSSRRGRALEVWAGRIGADIVSRQRVRPLCRGLRRPPGAKARETDVVFIDTAGRLHTKVNLMEELKKLRRIIAGNVPAPPMRPARPRCDRPGRTPSLRPPFNSVSRHRDRPHQAGRTAKGGIIVGITKELTIPIRYVGVGEGMDDLKEFNASRVRLGVVFNRTSDI